MGVDWATTPQKLVAVQEMKDMPPVLGVVKMGPKLVPTRLHTTRSVSDAVEPWTVPETKQFEALGQETEDGVHPSPATGTGSETFDQRRPPLVD
jgi:hypothetical protein